MRHLAFLVGMLLSWSSLAQQVPNPVSGPNSAVPGHLPVFEGPTGKVLKDSGVTPVGGEPPYLERSIAFWKSPAGDRLIDLGWVDSETRLLAPMNRSLTLQGTGVLQLGGVEGPYVFNDTALDTVSVIAKPGALPSGDTTNFQIYPPTPGGKVFLNLSPLASLSPPGEQRLIIGSLGATDNYVFSQVISGTGVCRDVLFSDGGPDWAWSLRCGIAGAKPALQLGFGVSLLGSAASLLPQSLLQLENSTTPNLLLGAGADLKTVVFEKPIGSVGTSPTLSVCGTTPNIVGGTSTKGLVVVGAGGVTTCTVAFASPYSSTPSVVLTGVNTGALTFWLSDVNPYGFTFAANSGSVSISGAQVMYHVIQ